MPRNKAETHEKILPAAQQEFMEKGFEEASMRTIADKIGMSAAGIYRHYANKEAMFSALVEPAVQAADKWYNAHKADDYKLLETCDMDAMWEIEADANMIEEVVYPNFDSFKLLICHSAGTKYENYIHELVMLEQRETIAFMEAAKAKGIPVKEIPPDELHLLLSAYITALFEIVVHDFPKEKASHYLENFKKFFTPGWRAVLGL